MSPHAPCSSIRALLRVVATALVASSMAACSGAKPAEPGAPAGTTPRQAESPETTKVLSLAVSEESLRVDTISMREGGITPDGNRDLVFTATVVGPADALFLVTCDEKGTPHHGFRADTISGHEELPPELGNVVDVGRMTVWIAVVEGGKFINGEAGPLGILGPGTHALKLYVPNTGNLAGGSHLRLYARAPGGPLAAGPVVRY